VVEVSRAQDPYVKREALKVSVFMNVFNVHSNRSPVDGVVKERWYFPGGFLNAALDKASLENERNALWLRTREGHDVTGVQFAGLFAIVQAMNGRFEVGAVAIYVAMVLDGMDGRVARWTNTQSEFGAQYDSIADMVAFGAAPALVAYEWALKDLGTLGWIAAFLYCAGTAIRLARFNVNIGVVDK